MASQKTKLCPACKQLFKGRPNALTCSARCRKRLSRARAALSDEVQVIEHTAERVAKEVEYLLAPQTATEEGFAAIPVRVEPKAPPRVPSTPIPQAASPLVAPNPAVSFTPAGIPSNMESLDVPTATASTAAVNPVGAFTPSSANPTTIAPNPFSEGQPAPAPQAAPAAAAPAPTTVIAPTIPQIPLSPSAPAPADNLVAHQFSPYHGSPLHETPFKVFSKWLYMGLATSMVIVASILLTIGGAYFISNHKQPTNGANTPLAADAASLLSNSSQASALKLNVDTTVDKGKKLSLTGQVAVQNEADSLAALSVQNAAGNILLVADTQDQRVGIGTTPTGTATLQVGGDVAISGNLLINSVLVCTSSGCKTAGLPFTGDASTLQGKNLSYFADASNLTTGKISPSLLGASVAIIDGNNTFSGVNTFSSASNSFNGSFSGSFSGDGSGLSSVDAASLGGQNPSYYTNATNIATGTLSDSRLSVNVTLQGNTFNGASQLIKLNNSGDIPSLSGINLTNLNASQLTSGTVNDLRLSNNVTLQGNTFNGASQLVQTTNVAYFPALNGSLITNLDAGHLATGTVNDLRLSANVALLGASSQTFSGNNTFSNLISAPGLETTSNGHTIALGFSGVASGDVNYNFDNTVPAGAYTICTTVGNCAGAGGGVTTPGGTANHLAKFSGAQTLSDSLIYDNGTNVYVNQTSGSYTLDVAGDINSTTGLRVGGNLVCTSTGCGASGGSGFYIQNGTGVQAGANFNIRSASSSAVGGVIEGASGQTADLLDVQSFGGGSKYLAVTTAGIDVAGSANVSGVYKVGGTQISSANLSNDSNLAKLNASQTFSGNLTFTGSITIQPAVDTTNIAVVQNHAGNSNLLIADTVNNRIGIGIQPAYTLDVNGDINVATGSSYRINGVAICGPSATCAPSAGSNNYVQNGVSLQANTNFNIQSVNASSIVGIVRGASGQTADILRGQDGNGNNVFKLDVNGNVDVTGAYKINGSSICSASGCLAATGSGNYVQNGTTQQTANFNIISAATNNVAAVISGANAGSADILDVKDGNANNVFRVGSDGSVLAKTTTNSTAGFQVQASSGANLLNIDTTNTSISLGQLTGGALAAWTTNTNALPAARQHPTSVIANGYAYLLGGANGTGTAQSTVYYAKLNSDGSVGTWTTNVNALPAARDSASSVVANGYVYVIGGENGTAQSTVYYAKLNADGSTGSWSTNANALPAARYNGVSVVANGYVYWAGGQTTGGTQQSAVYHAKLNIDGSVGAWSTDSSNPLPQAIYGISGATINGYIYILGGNDGTLLKSTVYYAKLNSDGSVGAWSTNANALPQILDNAASVVSNGYVYNIGGFIGTNTALSTVYYSSVQGMTRNSGQESIADQLTVGNGLTVVGNTILQPSTDSTSAFSLQNASGGSLINVDSTNSIITLDGNASGQLGQWATNGTSLPANRSETAAVIANGYAYVLGGFNSGVAQSTVYYAKLNADGSTGAWSTNANALPAIRNYAASVTVNGYIYLIGGSDGSTAQSTVYYAKLNADGSTGTWQTNANALPAARAFVNGIAANGYVYIVGGSSGSVQSTVYYAKLNADGSTGTWQTNANALPAAREWAGNAVANGYIYEIGGDNSGAQSTVYYAKLNADGSTGAWSTNANALPAARELGGTGVANGYVYVLGGENAGTPQSTVYYAKLNADGSTGAWAINSSALPTTLSQESSIIANGYIYVIGGFNGSAVQSTVYYASTSRLQVGANLDLIGLQSGDGSAGGSLTANNGTFAGSLQVLGASTFAQGLGVIGSTTIQAGASNSTSTFAVQNSSGTSLFTVDTSNTSISVGQAATGGLGSWMLNSNNYIALEGGTAALATANGYAYFLGGTVSSTVQSAVYYAKTNADGSLGALQTTTSLPAARTGPSAVIANGFIYVLGGTSTTNVTTAQSTVYYAKLNADGTVGSWNTNTNALPGTRYLTSATVSNGYIYAIGGVDSSITYQSTVYYAKLNADGSTGAWSTNANALPSPRENEATLAANGYIYVLGGFDGSLNQTSVYYAKQNSDGSTGSWTTNANALPAITGTHFAAQIGNYVYMAVSATPYYAVLNSNGSVGSWTAANAPAVSCSYIFSYSRYLYCAKAGANPDPIYYSSVQGITRNSGQESIADQLTVGNGLTVVGNTILQPSTDSTSAFSLQNATGGSLINVDSTNSIITLDGNTSGQLGQWSTASSLPVAAQAPAVTTANGYIYSFRGGSNSTAANYAKLNPDGSLGSWTGTTSLPSSAGATFGTAAAANGYVYVMGGCNNNGDTTPNNTVYYARVNTDGTLGSWTTSSNTLNSSVCMASSVVANGYIYVIGGDLGGGSGSTAVRFAKLNPDGSTSSWSNNASGLPAVKSNNAAVFANGYIYVLGGGSPGSTSSTVYYGKVNNDGTISSWTTSSTPLPANRTAGTAVASNGYIYFLGGASAISNGVCNADTAQSTVYYAKLNTDGSTGAWSTNSNALPTTLNCSGSAVANGYVYMVGGHDGASQLSSVYYASASRVQVGANLDLIGLQGADGSAGGSLSANNGFFGGLLQVQGQASFAQGLGVAGVLSAGPTTVSNLTSGAADTFVATNSSSSGSIAKFYDGNSTTPVFQIADGGAVSLQNQTNSSSAFQIQNAAGNQAVNVNTVTTPNLVSNGDFESTTNGWSGKGSATIARNDTTAIGAAVGVGALKITTTAAANDGASFSYTFAASAQYTLSLYARSSSGTVSTISIGHVDVSGTDIDCLTSQSITTTWSRFSCTFTTGGTITPPTQIYIKQSDATSRTFYIDGVQLEQASSASSFQANQANLQVQTGTNTVVINGSNSGAVGPWTTASNSLPNAAICHSSVILNGYIYVLGRDGNGSCQTTGGNGGTIYYAKLNADGSPTAWQSQNFSSISSFNEFSVATANGYIYILGGLSCCSSASSSVRYTKPNADGTLGTLRTASNSLPQGLYQSRAVAANGYLYVLGGTTISAKQSTVYYAQLNGDGSVGTWSTNSNALPAATMAEVALSANGYIYVIGGVGTSASLSTVYYASLNSNGSTSTWTTSSSALPDLRSYASGAIMNGYLYVIGGENGTAAQSTVYYSRLNPDGSNGAWVTNSNALPVAREAASSVAANGYIYVIGGGAHNQASAQSTVYYASAARLQIGGSLDLVGLQGGVSTDNGDTSLGSVGGSLTAGNGTFVGALQVQGNAFFAQGIGALGNLSISGSALFQNTADSTAAFQVQNALGRSLVLVDTTNLTVYLGITGSTNANSVIHIADSSAGVQAVTIGSTNSSSGVIIQAGTGRITLTGQLKVSQSGASPTVSESGAGVPTLDGGSTDTAGSITTSTTAHTSVTLTFGATMTNPPYCVVTPGDPNAATLAGATPGMYVTTTATTMVINTASDSTAATWFYHCFTH